MYHLKVSKAEPATTQIGAPTAKKETGQTGCSSSHLAIRTWFLAASAAICFCSCSRRVDDAPAPMPEALRSTPTAVTVTRPDPQRTPGGHHARGDSTRHAKRRQLSFRTKSLHWFPRFQAKKCQESWPSVRASSFSRRPMPFHQCRPAFLPGL